MVYLKPKQLIIKDCTQRFVLKLYRHEASRGLFATAQLLVKIWCTLANYECDNSHMTTNENFFIQESGRLPFWKSFFDHNSASDCLTSLKFCTGKHNSMIMEITSTQTANFENSTLQMAAILKIVKMPYLREKSSHFYKI